MYWLGMIVAGSAVAGGALLEGSLGLFFNLPSLLFVLLVGFGILMAAHGAGMGRVLLRTITGRATAVDIELARTAAATGVHAFVAAGWIGVMLGLVPVLRSAEDPARLGTSAANVLLTAWYGYLLGYLVCLPMARRLSGSNSPQLG